MQVKKIVEQAFLDSITPEQENAVLESIAQTVAEAKNLRKQQVDENVNLVLAGLKKVEANMVAQLGEEAKKFQKGLDGKDGKQGPKGEKGADGVAGRDGKNGKDGKDGRDGRDGVDGVSVVDARIDFDGSLVIFLSNGKEINAGEVVSPETAQKIHQITQHPAGTGSTSQVVLDTLASIQATIATYGTMARQNANNVAITGGTVNGTVLGGTTPAAGTFTTFIGGKDQANYGQLTGGATTKAVEFKSLGSDTNVALAIQTQGTGAIDLAAGSRGVNISNGGTVTAITYTASGSGYTSIPSCVISAPTTAGGVQATGGPNMGLGTVTVASGGSGYTVGDVLTLSGGTGTAATVTVATLSGSAVATVTLTTLGAYTVLPTSPVTLTGGTGTGATLTVNTWVCRTNSFNITNAGSGYVEQPTVSFSGGGGSGAAAYATVGSGTVIRALGATGNQTLDFYTPAGIQTAIPSLRLRDTTGDSFLQIQNQTATAILASQGNTNANLMLLSAGTGYVSLRTAGGSQLEQMRVTNTASAVNYVQVTGAATGAGASNLGGVLFTGSDTNVNGAITTKGSGYVAFAGGGATSNQAFRVITTNAISTGNLIAVQGAAAGSAPSIQAISGSSGTDTNIDLALTPKGTGLVSFGTYTAGAPAATGYISIKSAAGVTYKVLVST